MFSYPPSARLSGDPMVTTGNAHVQQSDNQIVITAQDLSPDETLVVEIPFAPGTVIASPPSWQQQQLEQRAAAPWWIAAGVALLAIGLVVLLVLYRRYRSPVTSREYTVYEPPSDLSPAMVGVINGDGAKRLGQRAGYLV
ncbi:MAG TPA: hypothetical protein VK879_13320 [Candidatus Sulfomarinibacteraceae bacterium]|nr:hypothetical protein [Candidatus Sulfomarinibacteraceae bacterium]